MISEAAPAALPVSNTVLSICCDYDGFPQDVARFREEYLYPKLRERNVEVIQCHGPEATIGYVQERIATASYITGAGHGSNHQFLGDVHIPVFEISKYNPTHVAGRIIHLTACHTACELGPDLICNGCEAFFGYNKKFYIPGDGFTEALECDAEIDIAFADGLDADAVYSRVMEFYEVKLEQLAQTGQYRAEAYLFGNSKALCAPAVGRKFGSGSAKL